MPVLVAGGMPEEVIAMVLGIGIVGAGANARQRHIPGFQQLAGVQVTAVCNRSEASGRRAATEFGIPRVFTDWKELVHAADVDAVCVGTWPNMHCPVVLETLAAGKHVLTEARMAGNLREAELMYAAAAASDRVAMVVPAPLYLEYEPTLLRLVADGFFGDWLEIHLRGMGGCYDPVAPLHWRQRRELSGDNVMSLGIMNETVRRYAGDERAVLAYGRVFTPARCDPQTGARLAVDVPDSLGVIAEMACGATAVYHLSSAARHGVSSALEFHGTRGALRLENGRAWMAGEQDQDMRELVVEPTARGGWRVEQDFVDAIRLGTSVTRTSFADGLKYMIFTEAVQRSLRQGRRIELPLR
jgi:predicted dehydrogenase